MSCVKCSIGQTGRCINDRTGEHAASVATLMSAGQSSAHYRECECAPDFTNVTVIARHPKQLGREILESLAIEESGGEFVSVTSVALFPKEKKYIGGERLLGATKSGPFECKDPTEEEVTGTEIVEKKKIFLRSDS